MDLLRRRGDHVSDWKGLAFLVGVDMACTPGMEFTDTLTTPEVKDASSFASALARVAVQSVGTAPIQQLIQILEKRLPPEGNSQWAHDVLSQFGFGGDPRGPASPTLGGGDTRQPSPSPAAGAGKTTIWAYFQGNVSLPWPVLVAAVSAHFNTAASTARPTVSEVSFLYITVPTDSWTTVAGGRDSWTIPAGEGLVIGLQSKRRDGRPFDPPALCHTPLWELWKAGSGVMTSRSDPSPVPVKRPRVGVKGSASGAEGFPRTEARAPAPLHAAFLATQPFARSADSVFAGSSLQPPGPRVGVFPLPSHDAYPMGFYSPSGDRTDLGLYPQSPNPGFHPPASNLGFHPPASNLGFYPSPFDTRPSTQSPLAFPTPAVSGFGTSLGALDPALQAVRWPPAGEPVSNIPPSSGDLASWRAFASRHDEGARGAGSM